MPDGKCGQALTDHLWLIGNSTHLWPIEDHIQMKRRLTQTPGENINAFSTQGEIHQKAGENQTFISRPSDFHQKGIK